MTRDDVRSLRHRAASRRSDGRFDICVGGRQRGEDVEAERDHIKAVSDAGATWWSEWVPPSDLTVMRAAVERGPLGL